MSTKKEETIYVVRYVYYFDLPTTWIWPNDVGQELADGVRIHLPCSYKEMTTKARNSTEARNKFIRNHFEMIQGRVNLLWNYPAKLYLELYPLNYLEKNEIHCIYHRTAERLGAFVIAF